MTTALSIQNLAKSYGPLHAVRALSFEVQPGEVFGLLGPNGAGKTTTLECIIGLRRPDAGAIHVAGIDALERAAEARAIIGVQLQSTALQDKITPRQALRLFASFYPHPADPAALLDQFHLADKADASFDTLSGGQRQRLALALALVHNPQIVFLDEPTAGLDAQSRRELHELILHLKSTGRTILLTTHYLEEAHRLCDRIAIINQGRIVATGAPEQLLATSKATPTLIVTTTRPLAPAQAAALAAVTATRLLDNRWHLSTTALTQTILSLVHLVEAEKNELLDLQIRRPSLEDVYLELTGDSAHTPSRQGGS